MQITGRWRIVDMELWDLHAIDLLGPAFVELRNDHQEGRIYFTQG